MSTQFFSLIINSFNVKLKMIQEQHIKIKIMSKQKKSEIVNRFRKRFDTKMTELGFTYQNIDLYQQAFSHSSFINDFNMNRLDHNERLSLGDAVLELTVSRYLFDKHPNLPEGNLTKMRPYCM